MARKPIARFRIYPEKRSLYWLVQVWPTEAAMRRHFRTRGFADLEGTVAQCSTYERYRVRAGRSRKKPFCGEINFHVQELSTRVIVHEATHAALGWAQRMGIAVGRDQEPDESRAMANGNFLCSDDEERFCYALDSMVGQINDRFHRDGLWSHR